jgi:hypothetical protein
MRSRTRVIFAVLLFLAGMSALAAEKPTVTLTVSGTMFTATVTDSGGPVISGDVFWHSAAGLEGKTPVDLNGQASIQYTGCLVAHYVPVGGANPEPGGSGADSAKSEEKCSDALPPPCTPAPTTVTLSYSGSTCLIAGNKVTLTATLTPANAPGTVTVYDNNTPINPVDYVVTLGDHTFTASFTSSDPCYLDSTSAPLSIGATYSVTWLQPVVWAPTSPTAGNAPWPFKGSVIPVKVRLTDFAGNVISTADVYFNYVFFGGEIPTTDVENAIEGASVGSTADGTNKMRFSDDKYILNWSVAGMPNGNYLLVTSINGDASGACGIHAIWIKIANKK